MTYSVWIVKDGDNHIVITLDRFETTDGLFVGLAIGAEDDDGKFQYHRHGAKCHEYADVIIDYFGTGVSTEILNAALNYKEK